VHSLCHMGEPSCSSSILAVDDEVDILDALVDLLTHEGFTVATATNGRDGLNLLAEIVRPCLILLDLMLPVMSGFEVLARLQADPVHCTIPVVVMTAARKPQPPGTRGILWKPFGVKELFAAVGAHCSKKEMAGG
jgi:two-component system chemotaxis response regulator CheY